MPHPVAKQASTVLIGAGQLRAGTAVMAGFQALPPCCAGWPSIFLVRHPQLRHQAPHRTAPHRQQALSRAVGQSDTQSASQPASAPLSQNVVPSALQAHSAGHYGCGFLRLHLHLIQFPYQCQWPSS
ncbi:hypothetical protein BS50DRAFT_322877 [Corynespora cassiicola Philippines]|uniref:Uncharacterized protein n=1 Tax=Corynespora cassiicola Philippines TaxID=1448308 RepID=A0A2T2NTD3_CORCC|nr:hypothetical protein BS50DRAFT_322877 [Corynespora cassiicola Philippines]